VKTNTRAENSQKYKVCITGQAAFAEAFSATFVFFSKQTHGISVN